MKMFFLYAHQQTWFLLKQYDLTTFRDANKWVTDLLTDWINDSDHAKVHSDTIWIWSCSYSKYALCKHLILNGIVLIYL